MLLNPFNVFLGAGESGPAEQDKNCRRWPKTEVRRLLEKMKKSFFLINSASMILLSESQLMSTCILVGLQEKLEPFLGGVSGEQFGFLQGPQITDTF